LEVLKKAEAPMGRVEDPIVICGAARTPLGAFLGALAPMSATALGSAAIKAAVERTCIETGEVDEVFMGCVLPAGLGQAPARQAALGAGLPQSVPCTTINKVCGSGMKATVIGYEAITAGSVGIVVCGGMESMSNAPYLLAKAREGYRMGHDRIFDHMMLDGLEDAYDISPDGTRRSMGTFGEECAGKYQFTRAQQDEFAIQSVTRAKDAARSGAFDWEMVAVEVPTKKGSVTVTNDEGPQRIDLTKIPGLRPAFQKDGTITVASSSSINDGAAALVLMRQSTANGLGAPVIARIVGHAVHAQDPAWFTTAPIYAIEKLLAKIGWTSAEVDRYEINEAFAVVAMAAMRDLRIPRDKINVHGGACALGHPIGATGARIIVTLLGALKAANAKKGMASLCIGGGEATAIAVEMVD
jgi:acetyl-CoA C-acetyltransferase